MRIDLVSCSGSNLQIVIENAIFAMAIAKKTSVMVKFRNSMMLVAMDANTINNALMILLHAITRDREDSSLSCCNNAYTGKIYMPPQIDNINKSNNIR